MRECKKGWANLETHPAVWLPPYPRIDSVKSIRKKKLSKFSNVFV
jgi:hypothetical protein